MSTRSRIGINDGEKIRHIYCHWDGYPSNNGKMLLEHYQDVDKINQLIDLGDISSLRKNIGSKHDWDNPPEDEVNAYIRDRGEDGCKTLECETADQVLTEEYAYVYDVGTGKWLFGPCEKEGQGLFAVLTAEDCVD